MKAGAIFASLLAQVVTAIALFFAVAAVTYLSDYSSGRHLFNSLWLVVALLAMVVVAYLVAARFVQPRWAVVVGMVTVLPALFTSFMVLAWLSFFVAGSVAPPRVAASPDLKRELAPAVRNVQRALPQGWAVLSVERIENPLWTFERPVSALLVRVYGPRTGYQDFFDASGKATRISYLNEGRDLWLVPRRFDTRLSFLNWTFAAFRLIPVGFPDRLGEDHEVVVFGSESSVVLPANQHYETESPTGAVQANAHVMPDRGGSWPSWQHDLGTAFRRAD